jgi:hypothetical protein
MGGAQDSVEKDDAEILGVSEAAGRGCEQHEMKRLLKKSVGVDLKVHTTSPTKNQLFLMP